ncbi:MAG: nickel pincer cofactor biosynthesis protein LarB [Ignavibacteriales bacterium]|nr:nickel pincer cofactor biosynthesis protein LarB [Ignavibacteriales bacterium]
MKQDYLRTLASRLKKGTIDEDQFVEALEHFSFESLGFATIDHHRELRQGFPEVILCEGKSSKHIATIARRIAGKGSAVLATRATKGNYQAVKKALRNAHYHPLSRTITANEPKTYSNRNGKPILVVTAGTADIPVAEEAVMTAEMMGRHVERLFDVGVAGIHRLLIQSEKLRTAGVIIVVAGMDGALPSVVGGMVRVPVIAVPTSTGYGASFHGVAALLTMLNSCAAGVLTVNIDNGFGAGFAASLITQL